MISAHKKKKQTGFFLSLSLYSSSLKHPWHRQGNICLLKSHFPLYHPSHHLSLQPRYAARQEIKVAGDLQEGLHSACWPQTHGRMPRLTGWLAGWLCCSPRSCLPHCRLILTNFSLTWSLMSKVQKARRVIFRMHKKCMAQNRRKGFLIIWLVL